MALCKTKTQRPQFYLGFTRSRRNVGGGVLSDFGMYGLYWSYDWWRSGMFKVMGVEQPKPQMQQGGRERTGSPRDPEQNGRPQSANDKAQTMQQNHRQMNHPRTGDRSTDREQSALSPVQIQQALNQTWTEFNQKLVVIIQP
jgi:sulfite reductase (NADPH) flavoprotein alpha-component